LLYNSLFTVHNCFDVLYDDDDDDDDDVMLIQCARPADRIGYKNVSFYH